MYEDRRADMTNFHLSSVCYMCSPWTRQTKRQIRKRKLTGAFLRIGWTSVPVPLSLPTQMPFAPPRTSGVPRNFFRGGFNKFSWGQRERGSGSGSPLFRGSGGSCNLVQEISFHIVKFSQFLVLQTIYNDNQFICHC